MDEAARLAEDGAEEGTVVVAETQTASRGRMGRTWLSQPGNLYLSVVLRPSLQALPFLTSLGAAAVVRAIRQAAGLEPRLKWPNDVLLSGRKVAGVLVETALHGDQVRHAILGIGINVELEPSQESPLTPLYERGEGTAPRFLGEEQSSPPLQRGVGGISHATSLNAQAGRQVPRDALLRSLLHALDRLYIELGRELGRPGLAGAGSPPRLLVEWRGLLDTLGQRVAASGPQGRCTGVAEGVDGLGNLLLRLDDGRLITLTAGDVTLAGRKT
jgi:BirA family biotin operon repressor/biotin-[acetyl-CoA-carboxylase] ligase